MSRSFLQTEKKKTTEVVEDFDGVSGKFDQVLSGTLDGTPALKDGKLSLKGKCTYTLDNVAMYHFKSFEIAASLDGEENLDAGSDAESARGKTGVIKGR